jgi:Alpha/beta hydrolase family
MVRPNTLQKFSLPLRVGDVRVEIAIMCRDGTGVPLVFLHGFGSTKEDYADVVQQEGLADRPVLAYDAPGCGASSCSEPGAVSIPFLVSVSDKVLRARGIERFHLIGHSMGGPTTASSSPRSRTARTSRCTPTPLPCGTASPRSWPERRNDSPAQHRHRRSSPRRHIACPRRISAVGSRRPARSPSRPPPGRWLVHRSRRT